MQVIATKNEGVQKLEMSQNRNPNLPCYGCIEGCL